MSTTPSATPVSASPSRIPEGFNTVTPHLVIRGCAAAIDFYKRAFGAVELLRNLGPDGRAVLHARLRIGDSIVMMHDEFPETGAASPAALDGSPITLHLYVDDADRVFAQAVAAGATVTSPMQSSFWGDRYGQVTDPFGHKWSIAHRIDALSPEDMRRRAADMFGG